MDKNKLLSFFALQSAFSRHGNSSRLDCSFGLTRTLFLLVVLLLVPWRMNAQENAAELTGLPIPYVQDFNSVVSVEETGITCFSTGLTNGYPVAEITEMSSYVKTGKSLLFKSSDTYELYVILPKLAVDLRELQMSFYYSNESFATPQFVVGYMTDPKDASTFVAVETLPNMVQNPTLKTMSFEGLPVEALNAHITFKYGTYANNNYWGGIDDININSRPLKTDFKIS